MDEQREKPRLRALKRAQIVFNNGRSAIDCTVRDSSAAGARLKIVTSIGVPDRFVLSIITDDVRHECRVIWRRIDEIGVAYD